MLGRGKIWPALLVGMALILLWPGPFMAQGEKSGLILSGEQKELKKLKKEVLKTKETIQRQKERERSILSRLNKIDKDLDKRRKEIEIYEFNLTKAKKKREDIKAQIGEKEKEIKRNLTQLKGRLRAIYKSGGVGFLRVVFSARSLSEILQSVTLMRYIAGYDARLLEKLRQDREVYLEKGNEFKEYQNRVNLYKESALKEKAALIKQQGERKSLLESVRKDSTKQVSLLKDMERRSEDLRKIIESGAWSGAAASLKALKGRLIWPANGKVLVPFGTHYDPVLNRKILNNGVDIKAPFGSDVLSIAPGKVLYADWFCGYGKLIIIDHGLGYNSIYAHALELFVHEGQMVKEGEKVAAVGDTDSIRGPELYFEIRFKGRPMNPVVWLSRKK